MPALKVPGGQNKNARSSCYRRLWTFIGGAQTETEVRVMASHPAGDVVTLGKNQSFYLHIAYSTDEPASIWARPFFQGREVAAGSNPAVDPTSHNLWPFEILQVGALNVVVIGVLFAAHKFSGEAN